MQGTFKRFEVLDSWRGLCACLVVFFHFSLGHMQSVPLVEHAYLAVDFFFVLSGFVIAHSYQEKLLNGFPLKDFIFLRLGRVYPVHFAVLMAFLALELVKFVVPMNDPPFMNEHKTVESLVANLFLIHSLGIFDVTTWNGPSWSISTEFYTYITYAVLLLLFRTRIWVPALVMMVAAPVALTFTDHAMMDMTYDHGFLRCLYGFSAGVLCYYALKMAPAVMLKGAGGHVAEILCIAGAAAFIVYCGDDRSSFLAPYVFLACVFVFSFEAGIISRALKHKAFLFLGMLSYTIYMTHSLVQFCFEQAFKIAEKVLNIKIYDNLTINGIAKTQFHHNAFLGDLLDLGMFAVILVFSWLVYRFFEKPCNDWFRRYVRRKDLVIPPQDREVAF